MKRVSGRPMKVWLRVVDGAVWFMDNCRVGDFFGGIGETGGIREVAKFFER